MADGLVEGVSLDEVRSFLTLDIPSVLPHELTAQIFCLLSAKDLCSASLCSRVWRERSNNDQIWHRLCRGKGWQRYSEVVDLAHEVPFSPSYTDISKTTPTFHSDSIIDKCKGLTPTCHWKQIYMRAWHLEQNWHRGRYRIAPVLRRHQERVTCLDSDGKILISGSLDGTVCVWDLLTSAFLCRLDGHTDAVSCLKLKDDICVTGCQDTLIRVFNPHSACCLMTLNGHQAGVECIFIVGDTIVSASNDKSVRVWSLSEGICTQILRGHTDDIESLKCLGNLVVSTSWDTTLRVWDISKKGECLHILNGHTEVVFCCEFNERIIVSGGGDSVVKIWDTTSGACLRTLEGHEGDVYCLCFNDDIIASGSADSTVRLWSHSGTRLRVMQEHIGVVRCLCLLGNRLVSGGDRKKIVVWDATNGNLLNVVHRNPSLLHIMWMNDTRLVTASPESPGTLTVMSYW
ncbi:F-box/WD repeat-containing protein 7-like [Asterias rubens]|uniref:F-box/WD repeat-containing protein 7-like n=1 Tax=Asterias rubens TaxID=7604 RepID=UPI0014553F4E|nr:F-box/WD repeat-containing protein 7-like [Asterias rubens]